ncbi:MAG: HAD family phosphatase [Coriobacteriaceae bacterium]|nr:HAD family phosphatase [Coriobacteriaceae bacterium]
MERPQKVDCVLFDCDGVLVDSEPVAARRNVKVFHMLDIPATYEDALTLCGCDGVAGIPAIAAKYGKEMDKERFEAKTTEARDNGILPRTIYIDPTLELNEGVRDLLVNLREKGVKCGLVSTTVAAHVLALLNRFGLVSLFDVIIAGDMVQNRKPNPEPYLTAMEILGTTPEHAVVVEDSPTGVAAGVASGAYVLGYTGSSVVQDVSAAAEVLASYAEFDLV